MTDIEKWPAEHTLSTEEQPLENFLAAVAQVDAELQRFYRAHQMGALSGFIPPAYESEQHSRQAPFWAEQVANWQNTIPEFSLARHNRLEQLSERYQLTGFELTVIILGSLNAFEPRYRELFSALPFQRNGQPTSELALALFCPGVHVRHVQQQSLGPEAPLLRYGLIVLQHDKASGYSILETPEWVRLWLLGETPLPLSLQRFTRWLPPSQDSVHPDAVLLASQDLLPPLIEARYAPGADGELALAGFAELMGVRALRVSWVHLLADERGGVSALGLLLNLSRLWGVLLVFYLDVPGGNEERELRQECLASSLNDAVVQAATDGLPLSLPFCCLLPSDDMQFPFPRLSRWTINITHPDTETRHARLLAMLGEQPHWDSRSLIQQVSLNENDMRNAIDEAQWLSRSRGESAAGEMDYRQAFLKRSRKSFGKLAQRVTPQRDWDDIVISDELQDELKDIVKAIRWREQVLHQGFARKVGQATGISALFHGNPGTGKTLVAEVLAREMGVDLIRVDLSTVVNKYIGETEKNLGRIFDLAARDAGVLFFDEADALFGKRSESKDAKDRHANIEVAYLLQRLEQHPGLVILATNNRGHLDDAFTRRFTFITLFTWPDAALREKMWRSAWPSGLPLAADVDFARLAQVQLTGANIRNISLQASWLAAGERVSSEHIEKALRREMIKMGRNT